MSLRTRFEVELASAATGGPLRATAGFGPETDAGLVAVRLSRPENAAPQIITARRAFAAEHPGAGAGPSWIRERCAEAAVGIAAALMGWCSAHGDTSARRNYLSELVGLDWAKDGSTATEWIARHGAILAELRSEDVRLEAPDVTHSSTAEHAEIFNSHILPELYSDLVPAPLPTGTVMLGSPARTYFPPGVAVIDHRLLLAYCQSWWYSLAVPQSAAYAEADAAGWALAALDRAVTCRAEVIVRVAEIDGPTAAVARECVALLGAADYPVRVEAVSAPDPIIRVTAEMTRRCLRGDWRTALALAGGQD